MLKSTLSRSAGWLTRLLYWPSGVVATMVWTSFSLLLRTLSEKPVRPLTIGPSIDQP